MNIKKIFNFLKVLIIVILFSAGLTYAAISIVPNGGTGVGTISGLIQGNGTSPFTPVTIGTGLSLSSGTLSATGGGGTVTSVTAPSPLISTGTTAIDILWQDPTHDGPLGFDEFDGTPSFWNIGSGLSYNHGTHTLSSVGTGGTVTSVTATTPLTGGVITSTGSIGCQTASGSQAGCLSSTDWTTFNNKGSGSVTSVGLSGGATGITVSGSPVTTSGSFQLGGTLGLGSGGTGTNLSSTPIFSSGLTYDVTDGAFKYTSYGAGFTYDHATHTLSSTTPLNQVTGALAGGAAQDSFNNKIDWEWNSLGNNTGLDLNLNGTQALTGQTLFAARVTGPNTAGNVSSTAALFSNTHTGAGSPEDNAATFTASGGATNNAIKITAGDINQASGNILTSGTLTLGNSAVVTSGGTNFHLPTTLGSNGYVLATDGAGNYNPVAATGAIPCGSTGNIQYADGSGGLGCTGNFNWNTGTAGLEITGTESINNSSSGVAGLSYTSGGQPFLTGSSDSNQAWLLAGNSLSGISFTSGGNGNNEVGMYENDGTTSLAAYTFRDDAGSGNPTYFYANKNILYDATARQVILGDARNINNFTKVIVDDANTAVISTNAVASPTMVLDQSGSPSATIANGVRGVYIDPASTLLTLSITLPSAPVDGQEVIVSFGGQITGGSVATTVTWNANSGQVLLTGGLGSPKAGESSVFKYRADISTWYLIN